MANLNVSVVDGNNVSVQVTPTPNQIITIDRGVAGPPGPNEIGGYPIQITDASNYDALMFVDGVWVNIAQTEITDGGNF
jgi:hypothetical protein